MKKWLAFFLPGYGIEPEERKEIVKYLVFSGWKSTVAAGCMVMLFELYFLINSFVNQETLSGFHIWYRASYIFLLICSIIGVTIILYCKRNIDRNWRIQQGMEFGYFICIIAWGLVVTGLDAVRLHAVSPILFMTLIICCPVCMYIEPLFYLIMDVVSSFLMLLLLFSVLDTGELAFANVLNFFVYFIIQTIVGCSFLQTRFFSCMNMREKLKESDRARAATEAKAAYLSNMSHEIRTPLNSILGMNEMIERDSHDPEILNYAANISQSGQTLLGLVNDMLDFSKIESGKMAIMENSYSLSNLVESVYDMIYILARKKGLELKVDIAEDTCDCLIGDQNRIRQIMVNLLSNAVKYTARGSVTLRAKTERRADNRALLRIEIEDTGMGIKKEDQPYLFDAFTRVDEDVNSHIEGTGLGLTICDRFIKLMQGTLSVESEYGHGSTFFFEIEQGMENDKRVGILDLRQKAVSMEAPPLQPKALLQKCAGAKVLVVDDNPMNLTLFQTMLNKTDLRVETAENGRECLEKIAIEKFDLIFMDHMMPQMDGLETFAQMHNREHPNSDTPVIMLTANAGAEDEKRYLDAGFATYLSKPFQRADLERILVEYLPEKKRNLLDTKTGLLYTDGNLADYHAILSSFVTGGTALSEELQRLLDDEDWQNYVIKVHSLKSSSRTIGALELSELAEELEKAGKTGDYDRIKEKNNSMLELYQKVLELGQLELAEKEPVSPAAPDAMRELRPNELTNYLKQLKEATDRFDTDELTRLCGELESCSCKGFPLKEMLQEVKAAVDDFDYEKVRKEVAFLANLF